MRKESVKVYKNPVIKEIAKVCHASDIIVREPLREGPQEFQGNLPQRIRVKPYEQGPLTA